MVQKQTRRRSSLIMGAMLALLLGVTAGFILLAMPIHMLETVTTFTRLSKLMVQAEPPISPNDRTLLAVLAGILTAGVGWVLVDWLLFGRAGMRTLIREAEDEYEDEEGDAFRPTDPLDLVAPVSLPTGDWAPAPSGDARRPLSARTDIGDPPKSGLVPGVQPAAMPGIDQLLPPIDQILPGVGAAAAPLFPPPAPLPPLIQPAAAPDPFQLGAQPPATTWETPAVPSLGEPAPSGWTPPDPPASLPASEAPAAASPAWLPTPGVRPDGSQSAFVPPAAAEPVADDGGWPQPSQPLPAAPSSDLASFSQPVPPLQVPPLQVEPGPVPPLIAPSAEPPQPLFAPMPETPPAAPLQQAAPPPLAFDPPAAFQPEPVAPTPPPPSEAIRPEPSPMRPPSTPRSAYDPGFDKARLEDLLARLERGLQNRRAAAARAAAQPPAPPPTPRIEAPPVPAMPEPVVRPDPFATIRPVAPPAAFTAPRPVAPAAPLYDLPKPDTSGYDLAPLPSAPPLPSIEPAAPSDDHRGDGLLDQPLHVTLELLRNQVRR